MTGAPPTPPTSPWGPLGTDDQPATTERARQILDSARLAFEEQGIGATTMAALADRAGISRVLLYRHFANRDAVVRALLVRDAARFVDGLRARVDPTQPLAAILTDAVAYAVLALGNDALLRRLIDVEPPLVLPFLTTGAGPVMAVAVGQATPHLVAGGLSPDRAVSVAETLTRLVTSCVLTPHVALHLEDEDTVHQWAAPLVAALVGSGPPRA